MASGKESHHEKSLGIMNEDRFLWRLSAKENSRLGSSSRVYSYYCGVSGSVPFLWESQPGTPKHTLFSDSSTYPLPLTPPPSYHSSAISTTPRPSNNCRTKKMVLSNVFRKKCHISPSFSWSSTSSSSSSSFSSSSSSSTTTTSSKKIATHCRLMYQSCSRSQGEADEGHDDDYEEEAASSSPRSTLCFGRKQRRALEGARGSGSPMAKAKKAFVSIIGRRRGIEA